MRRIRYEIECKAGAVVSAPGIAAFVATRGRANKAVAIVFVDEAHKEDFEKEVEGNPHVTGYRADPVGASASGRIYARA